MQHQIIPLFSVPVFRANIGKLDVIETAWVKGLTYPSQGVGRDGDEDHLPPENRGMHIIERSQLKQLKINIQNALDYFVNTVLGVTQKFKITTSWINKTEKDEFISKHSHPNSIISGVYYIETTPKCSPIVFSKPHTYTNIAHQSVQLTYDENKHNLYNVEHYGINPQPGDIVMFPSWLEHTVYEQVPNLPRIALAFNSFPIGTVGRQTYQNEL